MTDVSDATGQPPDEHASDAQFLEIAHGDRGVARHFRHSLEVLRDSTDDPGFAALVDDIVAGRKPPRALARSAAFDRVVAPRLAQATTYLASLDPAERARLEEQGRRELAELGEDD